MMSIVIKCLRVNWPVIVHLKTHGNFVIWATSQLPLGSKDEL
jgi:hypothetical protein